VPWQPLLTGRLAARAGRAILDIAADIPRHTACRPVTPGAEVGPALFFSYLARAGLGGDDAAEGYLEQAADSIAAVALPPALHGGYLGVAWAVEHLCAPPEPADEEDDHEAADAADPPGADVDAAVLAELAASPWTGSHDLIRGLVGIGVYALERSRRPGGAALLDAVAARLLELVEPDLPDGEGMALWTRPELLAPHARERRPEGQLDLGVSHGIAAAIGFLAGLDGPEARRACRGLAARLAAARRSAADGSIYPATIDRRDRHRPASSEGAACRAAWCYGDPGIAAALLRGARACGDGDLAELAREAALAGAARTVENAGVVDAGLCHGSAGLLHVFNRLHQATGEPALRAAALRWAEDLLDRGRQGEGVGGYASYQSTGVAGSSWVDDSTFLTGAAGVGLALLAATSDVEPSWDALLLCDVAPA
jgi:hypothetical protein